MALLAIKVKPSNQVRATDLFQGNNNKDVPHDKMLMVVKVYPPGMGAPPRGEPSPRGGAGSPPRPALLGGGVPRPVKMIKTVGKLRGKIKASISTFSKRGN